MDCSSVTRSTNTLSYGTYKNGISWGHHSRKGTQWDNHNVGIIYIAFVNNPKYPRFIDIRFKKGDHSATCYFNLIENFVGKDENGAWNFIFRPKDIAEKLPDIQPSVSMDSKTIKRTIKIENELMNQLNEFDELHWKKDRGKWFP